MRIIIIIGYISTSIFSNSSILSFYDKVNGNEPVANFTVHFNGTNNNTTKNATVNEGSSSSTSNNNDKPSDSNADKSNDKQYTKQDLERARSDGYWKGYDDSMSYYDDFGFVTTTDSGSSGSQSGSSSSGSSSGSNSP